MLMLWIVATIVFVVITAMVRRYVRQPRLVPTGPMNVLELGVEFIRDGVARPNLGEVDGSLDAPAADVLRLHSRRNVIGLIPIFDVLGLINHYVFHGDEHSFLTRLVHGSSTATGNPNVTAGLAVISFFAIILAGIGRMASSALGQSGSDGLPKRSTCCSSRWKSWGCSFGPSRSMARLAANMTGGHIALLAIIRSRSLRPRDWVRRLASGRLAVLGAAERGILGLELIVVLVQAYVFTLLSAVFIGMAIHAHH